METLEQREPPEPREGPEVRPPAEAGPLARRLISRVASDRSLTKKASLNAFAASVEQGARVIVGFVFTPFMVNKLGADIYGIWQILQRLIGHASPASGRPGEALKWTVAHDQTSEDYEAKRRAFGNAIAVWAIFTPLLILIAGAVAWLAPSFMHDYNGPSGPVRVAAAVLVVDAVLFAFFYLPQSILQGENLGYKRITLSIVLIVLNKGMLVGAVALGYGLIGMAIADMLGTVTWGIAYMYFAKQYVPWFGVAKPNLREVKAFIGLSWWFLVWNLLMQLMLASDVIVLGVVASPVLVTTYTIARFLPQAITLAVATLIFSVMPGLGGVVGAKDFTRAIRLRDETLAFIWLFSVITGAVVLLWERTFLGLWFPDRHFYPGAPTVLLIVLLTLQFSMLRTDANIIDLTLNLRRKCIIGTVSAVLAVGLAWYFLGPLDMGIFGLCLGFMIGRAILSVAYPVMIGRMLGVPLEQQIRGLIRPALATAAVLGMASLLGAVVDSHSWVRLILGGGMTALVVTLVTYYAGLSTRMRAMVWTRTVRVLKLT